MNLKKLTAIAAAVVMAAGICAGVPTGTENGSPLAITAEAADNGFVIETDGNGYKYVAEYKGKGGDIKIPDGINYVVPYVFKENKTITGVTFPKSCDVIGSSAFEECTSLKTVTFNGDAVILDDAFRRCSSLTSVTIKGSLRKQYYGYLGGFGIEYGAFSDCVSLKTVKIEKDEYEFSIENGSFEGCISLSSINIPSKCTRIGYRAFNDCFSLEKLTVPAKTTCGGYAGVDGNHPDIEQCCFGYACLHDKKIVVRGGKNEAEYDQRQPVVADGKTSGYYGYYKYWGNDTGWTYKYVTPKQLIVTVTKGSPAEEYCKENGIKYVYVGGSTPAVTTKETTSTTSPVAPTAPKLAAPTGIKGTVSENKIVLNWNNVSGAKAYRVYKYDSKTGKYVKYKDVSGTKCTVTGLKNGTKYSFKVYALTSENGQFVPQTPSKAVSFTTNAGKKSADTSNNEYITL